MSKRSWKSLVAAIGLLLLFSTISTTGVNATEHSKAAKKVAQVYAFKGTTLTDIKFIGNELAGKPTVIWFWAPWCTICRAGAPDIVALEKSFKGKVKVIGVAGLAPVADMKQFVADTKSSKITHLADTDGAIWLHFKVPAQPAFVFLNSKGVLTRQIGALSKSDLFKMTRQLLKKS